MNYHFKIHHLLSVSLINLPEKQIPFFKKALSYFEVSSLETPDLIITFKTIEGFSPIERTQDKMSINVPETIWHWHVLQYVELVLRLKALELNVLPLHAACAAKNGNGTLFLGSHGSGKTTWVLNQLENNKDYLSDDLTLVDMNANAYAYPRGINIKPWHSIYRQFYTQELSPIQQLKVNCKLAFLAPTKLLGKFIPIFNRASYHIKLEQHFLHLSPVQIKPEVNIPSKVKLTQILAEAPEIKTNLNSLTPEKLTAWILQDLKTERDNQMKNLYRGEKKEVGSDAFGKWMREMLAKERTLAANFSHFAIPLIAK